MRKLAASKPVHAAAGAGVLATETLRELTTRLTKLRSETSMGSLSSRANGYVTTVRTRASAEYDKLAKRGQKALNGHGASRTKGALNSKQSQQSHSRSTKS